MKSSLSRLKGLCSLQFIWHADLLTIRRRQRSTTSVTSSILEYRQLHGRTYHSDKFMVDYVFPNDDQQLESVELWFLSLPHSRRNRTLI